MFKSQAIRRSPRAVAATVCALALAVLAACGGGTTQYEPFVAERVIAFGDETSALRSDGKRFGTNGLTEAGAFDCNLEPLWVQSVAGLYGMVFAECNTATTPATPRAFMRAAANAKVADLQTQVDAQIAAGGFRGNDLALLAAGANDIFELYAQYPAQSREALLAEAKARGERMAQVVNRLVNLRARVVVANLSDLGLSPYARAQAAANPTGISRTQLITDLTTAFNEQLGIKVLLDGRYVGLAQMDLRTQQAGRSPGSFALADVSTAVCSAALPDCTTGTLITGGAASSYLWADGTRLASGGQRQLAQLAIERAQRNPF